ncbi:hypothetical protein LTR16_005329, partial [Cryomyces antarcticus]
MLSYSSTRNLDDTGFHSQQLQGPDLTEALTSVCYLPLYHRRFTAEEIAKNVMSHDEAATFRRISYDLSLPIQHC